MHSFNYSSSRLEDFSLFLFGDSPFAAACAIEYTARHVGSFDVSVFLEWKFKGERYGT
jgi:hypothetical protein